MGYNSLKQMKKTTLLALPLVLAMAFTGCTDNDTPSTTKTKLWPAYSSSANLYGYINKKGEWAIPAQFSEASSFFSAGYAIVKINGNQAFIDTDGKVQSCVSFDSAEPFIYKFSRAELNNKFGMINTDFEFAIQPVYSYLSEMTNDGIVTYQASGDKFGFLDKKGNVLMKDNNPIVYESADAFRDGYCVVSANMSTDDGRIPTYALIDTKGNIQISEGRYMNMGNMGLGIVGAVEKDKDAISPYDWHILKADGSSLSSRIYNRVSRFSEDKVAWVGIKDENKMKYGYIDADGKEVISLNHDEVWISTGGYAWVLDENTYKLLDVKNGSTVLSCQTMTSDVKEAPLCGVHNGLTLVAKATNYNGDTSVEFRWVDVTDGNRTVYSWNYNKDKNNGDLDPSSWAPARKNNMNNEHNEYVFLK